MATPVPAELHATTPAPESSAPPPVRKRWSMTMINFWLDATLFVAMITMVWITVMLQVVFPAPTTAAGWTLWGLTYDQWRDFQFYALCVAAGLTVEHIVLHWNWVCTIIATRVLRRKRLDDAQQAVFGVSTFIVLLLLVKASLLIALFSVQKPTVP